MPVKAQTMLRAVCAYLLRSPAFSCRLWYPHFCWEVTETQGPGMIASPKCCHVPWVTWLGCMGLEPLRPVCVLRPLSVLQFPQQHLPHGMHSAYVLHTHAQRCGLNGGTLARALSTGLGTEDQKLFYLHLLQETCCMFQALLCFSLVGYSPSLKFPPLRKSPKLTSEHVAQSWGPNPRRLGFFC